MTVYRRRTPAAALLAAILAAALSACGGPTTSSSGGPVTTASQSGGAVASGGGVASGGNTTASGGGVESGGNTTASGAGESGIVPDVGGLSVQIAELYLKQVGLGLGKQLQEPNVDLRSGLVITTDPADGQKESRGYPVNLLVSTGSPGCQQQESGGHCDFFGVDVKMPYVLGQTLQQAKTTLTLSGITLGSYVLQASSAPYGAVTCSVPAAGIAFDQGQPVSLFVSSGNGGSPAVASCGTSSPPPSSPPPSSPPPSSPPPSSPPPSLPPPSSPPPSSPSSAPS